MMMNQRIRKSSSWGSPSPGKNSPFAPRPFAVQAQRPDRTGLPNTLKSGAGSLSGVVQLAGTKPRAFAAAGRYMVKLSSAREKYVYETRGDSGMEAILPGYHGVTNTDTVRQPKSGLFGGTEEVITRVQTADLGWINLDSRMAAPKPGQEVLVIDTLGYEDPATTRRVAGAGHKAMMDIKIGTYTKSGEQFKLEGAGGAKRFGKKLEHNFKDVAQRTSRGVGYDICDGEPKFKWLYEGTKGVGGRDWANFQTALGIVMGEVRDIELTMKNAPLTFVGSSIFVVINVQNPEHSTAKLIDPDHPIITDNIVSAVPRPGDVMDSGKYDQQNPEAERGFGDYAEKWQESFNTGVKNVFKYFNQYTT